MVSGSPSGRRGRTLIISKGEKEFPMKSVREFVIMGKVATSSEPSGGPREARAWVTPR